MESKTLSVPTVHCGHCVSSIESAVSGLEGVSEVKVDLDSKDVKVEFDPNAVTVDQIVTTIRDQGYDVGGENSGGLMQIGQKPE